MNCKRCGHEKVEHSIIHEQPKGCQHTFNRVINHYDRIVVCECLEFEP